MPYIEKPIQKIYWRIGEVAKMLNVHPSAIRFWEIEFGFKTHRDHKGDRRFNAQELAAVKRIHHLLKVEGYTIPGAKRRLAEKQEDDFAEMENMFAFV